MSRHTYRVRTRALFLGGGTILVLAGALPLPTQLVRLRLLAVILGLLLFITGVVRPFGRLLPDQRKYLALRRETDRLLEMVRKLHRVAVDAESQGRWEDAIDPIVRHIHEQVDRLPELAGVTEEELLHPERLHRV